MNTVSVTEFRNNLSEYLKLAKYKGESINIFDEKSKKTVARLTPPEKEDGWDEYMELLESSYGMLPKIEDKGRKALRKADRNTMLKRLKK